ncbi:Protein sarah [Sarcoptes scabiei]|uniref:Calcipressin-2-like protein n=1 Tax=Sarcoptes scabiei TaxID=52283 RepID=A0A131ZY36_SARSC|nr:Protein sarah [Sarcoptes scabiei]KPM03020.1 calcipressin-2-like protein [Sarcoptes scabiei]
MDREQSIPPKSSEIATNEQEINANNCSGEIDIDNDYIRFLDRTTKTLMLMKDDDVGFDLELNRIIHGERDDHNDPNQNNALGCDEQFPLPKSLIITNMDYRIFDPSSKERNDFEKAFRHLDPEIKFSYFKSFHRARLDFQSQQATLKARIVLNQVKFGDEAINCYFAEVSDPTASNRSNDFLKPPALEKQFLISPPASPPEGWEPVEEAQPILNIDLQTALANLLPGSTHELHPPTSDQPAIVVHICDDSSKKKKSTGSRNNLFDNDIDDLDDSNSEESVSDSNRFLPQKIKICHTPCPPSMQHLRQT